MSLKLKLEWKTSGVPSENSVIYIERRGFVPKVTFLGLSPNWIGRWCLAFIDNVQYPVSEDEIKRWAYADGTDMLLPGLAFCEERRARDFIFLHQVTAIGVSLARKPPCKVNLCAIQKMLSLETAAEVNGGRRG
jgi:hypothetical protein